MSLSKNHSFSIDGKGLKDVLKASTALIERLTIIIVREIFVITRYLQEYSKNLRRCIKRNNSETWLLVL